MPTGSRDAGQAIAGEQVHLEPLTVDHAEELAGVLADPALYRFVGGEPPDVETLRDRYGRLVVGHSADGGEVWLNWVVRVPGGAAAGTVQATLTDGGRHAEVAWVIGVPWQGKGYATDAARAVVRRLLTWGVEVVVAHVHPDHAASAAVARGAGLEPTDVMVHGERRWQLATAAPSRG